MRNTAEAAKRCGFLEKTTPGQNVADSSRKRPRGKTLRIPLKTAPGAGGRDAPAPTSPLPELYRFRCVSKPQETLTHIYPQARHAGPRGRRTSPACGSCRRPRKSCDNQGNADRRGRILDLKERKERFACTRGRAHRGKAPSAAYPFVFSRGRANPSKSIDSRAPAKEKSAQ